MIDEELFARTEPALLQPGGGVLLTDTPLDASLSKQELTARLQAAARNGDTCLGRTDGTPRITFLRERESLCCQDRAEESPGNIYLKDARIRIEAVLYGFSVPHLERLLFLKQKSTASGSLLCPEKSGTQNVTEWRDVVYAAPLGSGGMLVLCLPRAISGPCSVYSRGEDGLGRLQVTLENAGPLAYRLLLM